MTQDKETAEDLCDCHTPPVPMRDHVLTEEYEQVTDPTRELREDAHIIETFAGNLREHITQAEHSALLDIAGRMKSAVTSLQTLKEKLDELQSKYRYLLDRATGGGTTGAESEGETPIPNCDCGCLWAHHEAGGGACEQCDECLGYSPTPPPDRAEIEEAVERMSTKIDAALFPPARAETDPRHTPGTLLSYALDETEGEG